jgi:hypothetical protein
MLSHAELLATINYDPDTGAFTNLAGVRLEGPIAKGYLSVRVLGRTYYAHRLAWFYVFGEWPPRGTDHVDTNRKNNAIANLRPATKSQNGYNRGAPSNSTTGLKGASFDKFTGRFVARLKVRGRCLNLGRFDTAEEANAAYVAGASQHCGEFARG